MRPPFLQKSRLHPIDIALAALARGEEIVNRTLTAPRFPSGGAWPLIQLVDDSHIRIGDGKVKNVSILDDVLAVNGRKAPGNRPMSWVGPRLPGKRR